MGGIRERCHSKRQSEVGMSQKIFTQVLHEFHPKRLLPSLTAGLVAGIVTIVIVVSFAAMIFSGDLSKYVSSGIGFTLMGGFVE